MEKWNDFFVAQAGASAALAGLIFVAVSLNLKRILSVKALPNRSIQSLIMLVNILLVASVMLVPGQPVWVTGIETAFVVTIVWVMTMSFDINSLRTVDKKFKGNIVQNMVLGQIGLLPFIVGAVILCCGNTNGLYFILPGIILSFMKSVLDAWVLLVEINR